MYFKLEIMLCSLFTVRIFLLEFGTYLVVFTLMETIEKGIFNLYLSI